MKRPVCEAVKNCRATGGSYDDDEEEEGDDDR
jgi:hypothetical protein